jgi:hypothetical protein
MVLKINNCFNGPVKGLARDNLMKQLTGPFQLKKPSGNVIPNQLLLLRKPKMVQYDIEVEITVRESLTIVW